MYLNITASKDTYIHNKIINSRYRTSDSNVGLAGTLDLFKLYGETSLPGTEAVTQSEIVSVSFPAHNPATSNLDSRYFFIYDHSDTKYYVWFNVDGGSQEPTVQGATGIEVPINASAEKTDVAAAAATAVGDVASFSTSDKLTGEIEITVLEKGLVLNASNGNIEDSLFVIAVEQQGQKPGAYNIDVDGDGTPETAIELSRLLLSFDLSSLSGYPTLDTDDSDFKATLRLYDILDGQMAPTNFNVEVFPLAKTFTEGIGRDTGAYADLDICNFVTASYSGEPILWNELGANAKGNVGVEDLDVYCSSSGGAEQLYVTKEFIEGTEDFSFDVTNIVKQMLDENSGIPQYGFRLSFSELEEQDGKTYFLKRFASRHVLNQYLKPRLTISWNDSFRDNSKNSVFDNESMLLFQNTVRGSTLFATSLEHTVNGTDNSLALTLSTGSWSSTYAVPRHTANGNSGNEITGLYASTFTIDTLDGVTPRVVSSENEIIRISLVDHDEDSENLIGYYFSITNNEDPAVTYNFWFGETDTAEPVGLTNPTKITITAGDDSSTIATIAAGVINSADGLTASVFSIGIVHVTVDTEGSLETAPDTGDIPDDNFTISSYQEGNSVTLQDHIIASGSVTFDTIWSGNTSPDGSGDSIVLHTDTLKIAQSVKSSFDATRRNMTFSLLNVKDSYKNYEKAKFRIFARDLNQQNSSAKIALEIDSVIFDEMYYRIRDVVSGDLIIPFEDTNNGTRASTDSAGMYFDIDMSSLFPGRSYTVDLLIVADGNESVFECKNTRFRVEV